jgi:hypothetical protein
MNTMLWLSSLHPAVPWALLTLALWLAQWGQRRWLPTLWERAANVPFGGAALGPLLTLVRKVWQGLPSVLVGALAGALLDHSDPRAARG